VTEAEPVKILIIEDEERLAQNIARSLRDTGGFAVDIALNGIDGLHHASGGSYDAICVDLMLPNLSGTRILAHLRKAGIKTPVLILTAREGSSSIVTHLNLGADDYLSKPFELEELQARLKAIIRRSHGHADAILSIADLKLDTVRAVVSRGNETLVVSPMEYRVLEYLFHHAGRVVPKRELLEHLYDFNWEKFSNVIEVYISGLRRKIDWNRSIKLIHTVRGHGYMLQYGSPE
jgi:DNA-binding response OmpR family regulator